MNILYGTSLGRFVGYVVVPIALQAAAVAVVATVFYACATAIVP